MNGVALQNLIVELLPIMRSITGPGVRESLNKLQSIAPITIHSVPSGKQVLDWTVPDEWHFREAWITDASGKRIVDAANSTLSVVNFSVAIEGTFTREELLPHLHTLPDQPDSIPYRTAYYSPQWGFCLPDRTLLAMGDGPFHVKIDTDHVPGALNYGELLIPGKSENEILVSTHICHPQLANDNLSGMILSTALASTLLKTETELSWRFIFVPGTIGAITWLSENQNNLSQIVGGMVLTGLGDDGNFNWKQPRTENTWFDNLVSHVLHEVVPENSATLPFTPYGYDERQYCSPGFNLPIGRLTRSVFGTFPEYHTSDDNVDFVKPERLAESLNLLENIARSANQDVVYRNLYPFGEPQLGKRGLYSALGATVDIDTFRMSLLWVLNQSDGHTSLSEIARKSDIDLSKLANAALQLIEHGLLEYVRHSSD